MSGAFETLIYTDCRPGQGLNGTAGLQFQAASPDAGADAMALVQRGLLYEAPAEWMREGRAVDTYPPSFAYILDESIAAIAAGVYLGKEANGMREGNQLTHSIVTRTPATSLDTVRPAQLFGADFWTTSPAATTRCEPITEDWQPGPYDAMWLRDFVQAQPKGADLLVSLVSALEGLTQPQARRILFVAERPEPVIQWIAAGTVLIPRDTALTIGFKVFSTNPSYAPQQIVAVHPDWGQSLANVDVDQGYLVFDLTRTQWSTVEPTESARDWVHAFLTEDAYDVLDEIEAAAGSGLPDHHARVLARTAVARQMPDDESTSVIIRWLADGPDDLRTAYRDPIADVLTEGVRSWPIGVLRELDEAGAKGLLGDRASLVRQELVTAEAGLIRGRAGFPDTPAPAIPAELWNADARQQAKRTILSVAETPGSIDAALRLASRFGLPVAAAELGRGAQILIDDWIPHPERPYDEKRWPCGQELLEMLRGELIRRYTSRHHGDVHLATSWWKQLLPWVDEHGGMPPDGLTAAVLAAAMAGQATNEGRRGLAGRYLRRATATSSPEHTVAVVAKALWADTPANWGEIALLLDIAPRTTRVDVIVFRHLVDRLNSGDYDAPLLALGAEVLQRGITALPTATRELLVENERIDTLFAQLPKANDETLNLARRVATAPLPLRRARAHELAVAADQVGDDLELMYVLLIALPADTQVEFFEKFRGAMGRKGNPAFAARAYYLGNIRRATGRANLDPGVQSSFAELAADWIRGARKGQRKDAKDILERFGLARRFSAFEAQLASQGRRFLPPRPRE